MAEKGRFLKIGIPYVEVMVPIVGVREIIFGLFVLIGFIIHLASIPQLIIIPTALPETKISLILEKEFLTFSHDARNDLLMLFGLIFLIIKGSGAISIDRKLVIQRN